MLARRDHSRAELARKLVRYVEEDGDATEVDRVLDQLERDGLMSDERFARGVANNRARRFGDARIRHDLRRFGVSNDVSGSALQTLNGSELARARGVWSRRFGALPLNAAERAKQARFLQQRGFSLDTVFKVLRGEDNDGG